MPLFPYFSVASARCMLTILNILFCFLFTILVPGLQNKECCGVESFISCICMCPFWISPLL
uniref:Uncharacterized protein n=1 Tax=Rhizophora mucronata TaxID=61149 RepID=A0A2P2Q9W4_RHIMU